MTGYSLQFFTRGRYDEAFWDTVTPEIAQRMAERARSAGCTPNPDSKTIHGVPTAWVGPDVGRVLYALKNEK